MYIIGTRKSEEKFEEIIAIFKQLELAQEWLKKHHLKAAIHQVNVEFPFYVIDHFTGQPRYQTATADEIKSWAETLQKQESSQHQYFLFFRITENLYNKAFPGEYCLNGVADHYHIKNIELNLILTSGVDSIFLYEEED